MAVQVIFTAKLENAFLEVLNLRDIPQELLDRLSPYKKPRTDRTEGHRTHIAFELVREVWQQLRRKSSDEKPVYLHELLEGSEIYVEPPKPPDRSPELEARLRKLKAQQDRKEYDKMIANVGTTWDFKEKSGLATEVRSTAKQASSIVNFLLSLVAAFVFGFVSSQYAYPTLAMRVIIGVMLACLVAVAELYFMARTEI